jgi:3'DNA-binding domain (3'BD)
VPPIDSSQINESQLTYHKSQITNKPLSNSFFPEAPTGNYINVILPIAIPKAYTYLVPPALETYPLQAGMRVEVPFGKMRR